jgi:hypothetical protein
MSENSKRGLPTELTQQEVCSLLSYDCSTGEFRWRETGTGRHIEKPAGYLSPKGYRYIGIGRRLWSAHRLAWLYVFGFMPKQIDHINCDKSDNRIANLREASNRDNALNRGRNRKNTSGHKGVTWYGKPNNKWVARITDRDGKRRCLGYFQSLDEAAQAYKKAAIELHGEFARF